MTLGKARNLASVALFGTLALAGCEDGLPGVEPTPPPSPAPSPALEQPSEASKALTRFYARLENDLIAQGLLRVDGGGVDTPYTDNDLLRNFEMLAFFEEYQRNGGLRPSDGTAGKLSRWVKPVRLSVEFGPNVPDVMKEQDRANIRRYVQRLSRVTGHPITLSQRNPNFTLLIMSSDDADIAQIRALELLPWLAESNLVFFSDLPRSIQCFVIGAGTKNEHELDVAVAYIRSENRNLQRLACIHEEIAQGLGLANDSSRARPSIFNDDDEFALLTSHDEQLLAALYNSELKPGMSLEEARPILRGIFAAALGGS